MVLVCLSGVQLQTASRPLVLRGGTVVDVVRGRALPDVSIIVRAGRIERMGPTPEMEIPVDAEVVDVQGKFLIPGLFDMHTHYRDWVPELFLAHGVTSVRDCGNQLSWLLAQKRGRETGVLSAEGTDWMSRPGPRLFVLGALNTYPNGRGHHYKLKTLDEARAAVDSMAAMGLDGFKGLPGLSLEMIKVISEQAAGHGLRLTVHLATELTVRDAVLAGVQGIEHDLDLATHPESEALDTVSLMARKGVYWTPMLAYGYKDVLGVAAADAAYVHGLVDNPSLKYLPDTWRQIQRVIYPAGGIVQNLTSAKGQKLVLLKRLVKAFVDKGGRLLPGTDSPSRPFTGFSLIEELETMVAEFGLSPLQALQTATIQSADYFHATDLGRLEPAARADIVVLDGNPLQDIKNLRRVAALFMDGQRVSTDYHPNFVQLLPRPIIPGSTVFIGEGVLKSSSAR